MTKLETRLNNWIVVKVTSKTRTRLFCYWIVFETTWWLLCFAVLPAFWRYIVAYAPPVLVIGLVALLMLRLKLDMRRRRKATLQYVENLKAQAEALRADLLGARAARWN